MGSKQRVRLQRLLDYHVALSVVSNGGCTSEGGQITEVVGLSRSSKCGLQWWLYFKVVRLQRLLDYQVALSVVSNGGCTSEGGQITEVVGLSSSS